jgi:hypothetical protein
MKRDRDGAFRQAAISHRRLQCAGARGAGIILACRRCLRRPGRCLELAA